MARQQAGRRNRPAAEVATVNGKKRLLVGGRLVQTKADVRQRIARLTEAIEKHLPGVREALDAQELLAQARARINRRIETLRAVRDDLAAKVEQLDD